MSKLSKFVKSTNLFMRDMILKRTGDIPKPVAKPVAKPVKAKTTIIETLWNKISVANISLRHYEVALYFGDKIENIYQVEQWIPIFEHFCKTKNFSIITREQGAYQWIVKNTNFTCIYCRTLADLQKLYDENDFKCILYVNHSFKNFQSMINGQAFHIHINHGESDKTSTITRQSQAYDYIFVYGDESINKYSNNLISCDINKYIKIGRPQIEHVSFLPPILTDRKIVMYAPTWEGTHETMDFTSLRTMGLAIVNQLLNDDNFFLIYKPHPKVGVRDSFINQIDKEIVTLLSENEHAMIVKDGDIVSYYKNIDIGIFDNSVVLIDFLPFNKPIIITDVFKKDSALITPPLLKKSGIVLDKSNLYQLSYVIETELAEDTTKESRNYVRQQYLGDFNYGQYESTQTFIKEIVKLSENRDLALNNLIESTTK